MGFDDRDAGRADEHGAVLRRRGEAFLTGLTASHISWYARPCARYELARKGPRFLMGTGAFVFLSGVKGLCRTPS